MQIIKQLYQISLRKREPQDLDYSLEAAVMLTMSIVFLRYVSFLSMSDLSSPLAYSVASIFGEVVVIYALLRGKGKANRFVQTLTALFGVTLIATAVSVLMTLTVILQLALPVLLIWTIYLMILILRSALECSTLSAVLLTIAYNVAGYLLVMLVFPKFQAEMQAILETINANIQAAQIEAQSK